MDAIGLSREKGLKKLNNVLEDVFKKKSNEKFGMFSEHLILLAAISLNQFKPKKILEIEPMMVKQLLSLVVCFHQQKS